ncbi:hypothetical protein L9F63_005212 [Diploptera punctata]|uniref:Protein MIS12 homolog n=1 Tax=Diploptera punctata TaxID=6984 RepID=A0AAD8E6P4_DIPPU|nr:hypothetical protein L9F63_005212 [Diploptera punctata]
MSNNQKEDIDFVKDMYELQLLGFTTRNINEYVDDSLRENIRVNTVSLKKTLLNTFSNSAQVIEIATQKFLDEALDVLNKQSDQLKSVVDDFFGIPSNMLLPEDEGQSRQFTLQEEQDIDREIQHLQDRYKRACFMEDYIKKEITIIEKVKKLQLELEEIRPECFESEKYDKIEDICTDFTHRNSDFKLYSSGTT